ncbi:hypothetical protein P1X14_15920 [Sphingomonas sp. AOB5]|uniref:hypothetical protein n=1 Tax=Sphingomonas sp. AOB5 TaxID=3034017 RepID=UPI0023F809AA|nr:hypothetical protein [Sphingomonas sp. AOB5]MDF7776745.1 hypothetical protein [Sphingomonas sp. AOB5]
MIRALKLLAMCFLFAGLVGGSIAHAAETAGGNEATEATHWLHGDGDEDQVPADSENGYPHHHNVCHGHDIASPAKFCAPQLRVADTGALKNAASAVPGAGPPGSPLRPPIA